MNPPAIETIHTISLNLINTIYSFHILYELVFANKFYHLAFDMYRYAFDNLSQYNDAYEKTKKKTYPPIRLFPVISNQLTNSKHISRQLGSGAELFCFQQ